MVNATDEIPGKQLPVKRRRWLPLFHGVFAFPTPRTGFYSHRAFISYRTAQHQRHAEAINAVLENMGYEVFLDRRFWMPSWMGLGLDFFIKRGLTHSDALVFLVPSDDEHSLSLLNRAKDMLDFWLVAMTVSFGLSPGFWYGVWCKALYGKTIVRSPFALLMGKAGTWQKFELQASQELGLRVIRVVLEADDRRCPSDTGDVIVRLGRLEEDVRTGIAPILDAGRNAPALHKRMVWHPLRLALVTFGFFAGVVVTAAVGMAILLVVGAVVLLVRLF